MPADGIARIEATVRGHVQGVGFRWFVREAAQRIGLAGWVSNEADGSVRVVAEGSPEALGRLVERLRTGPAGASVQSVDVADQPPTGSLQGFGIRSRWHTGD
jgi:acylphosphatase